MVQRRTHFLLYDAAKAKSLCPRVVLAWTTRCSQGIRHPIQYTCYHRVHFPRDKNRPTHAGWRAGPPHQQGRLLSPRPPHHQCRVPPALPRYPALVPIGDRGRGLCAPPHIALDQHEGNWRMKLRESSSVFPVCRWHSSSPPPTATTPITQTTTSL